MKFELLIQNGSKAYQPLVQDGVQWTTERKGVPSKLKFSVIQDGIVNFTEGNAASLKVDGQKVFYGFVFIQKRDKQQIIDVTAYDQMRYLKNKDVFNLHNITASDVIKKIGSDFRLNLGAVEETSFIIPDLAEDNSTLLDIIYKALDFELTNKKLCMFFMTISGNCA